jgi:hypothetical protein
MKGTQFLTRCTVTVEGIVLACRSEKLACLSKVFVILLIHSRKIREL